MRTLHDASTFTRLALTAIHREVPHKLDHVVTVAGATPRPRELHPAFFGSFDWHSAVHGHWMLVRLLRVHPALPEAAEVRRALDLTLTADALAVEAAYLRAHPAFERPYGWAWLLQLATELHAFADPDAARWAAALAPLADVVVEHALAFFPKLHYPVRSGVHANTAFALALALDHARATGHATLEALVVERARTYYEGDRDAPAAWEPSGEDFFSPVLLEADLMRRVLPAADFPAWLHALLPRGLPPSLAQPAVVSDRTDGKLAHLDGLQLSRAWCLRAIAAALPASDPRRAELAAAADAHARAARIATGDYAGEHWLASFAVYLGR